MMNDEDVETVGTAFTQCFPRSAARNRTLHHPLLQPTSVAAGMSALNSLAARVNTRSISRRMTTGFAARTREIFRCGTCPAPSKGIRSSSGVSSAHPAIPSALSSPAPQRRYLLGPDLYGRVSQRPVHGQTAAVCRGVRSGDPHSDRPAAGELKRGGGIEPPHRLRAGVFACHWSFYISGNSAFEWL